MSPQKRYRVHFKDGSSIGPILADSPEQAKAKVRKMGHSPRPTGPFSSLVKDTGGITKVEKDS